MKPLVVQIENVETRAKEVHTFKRSPIHLGRNELNDLPLREPFVSLWHALIRFDEQSIRYVDLGSTNGTTLNGERLEKNKPQLVDGSVALQIGPLRVRLTRDEKLAAEADFEHKTQFRKRVDLAKPGEAASATQVLQKAPPQAPKAAPQAVPPPLQPKVSPPPSVSPPTSQAEPEDEGEEGATTIITTNVLLEGLARRKEQPSRESAPAKSPLPLGEGQGEGSSVNPALGRSESPSGTQGPTGRPSPPALSQREREHAQPAKHSGAGDAVLKLLASFARTYVPQLGELSSEREAEQFLDRLADVLETCGQAFIELRKGHDQFGSQMALPTAGGESPLRRVQEPREVLAYVLDWKAEDRTRVESLKRGFTDIMIHQIALLNGMQEGVRGMLAQLSPERIEQEAKGIWPFLSTARWRRFIERYEDLVDDEQALSSALFGPEFARAYAAIVGDSAGGGVGGAEDEYG